MREASPNQFCTSNPLNGRQRRAKSLFRNILSTSPCGSRFYPDSKRYPPSKMLRINTLGKRTEKIWADQYRSDSQAEAKSLFRNILAVSHCGSIFYGHTHLSTSNKSLRMN